ncbi:MAG: hypothetical protein CO095_09755, partial [Armatimonadetes bacterium CG_4_9_14_3_um_filter_58_7]
MTIAADLITIRQFLLFRRRSDPQSFVPSRTLHHRSMESHFVPYVFSRASNSVSSSGPSVSSKP